MHHDFASLGIEYGLECQFEQTIAQAAHDFRGAAGVEQAAVLALI